MSNIVWQVSFGNRPIIDLLLQLLSVMATIAALNPREFDELFGLSLLNDLASPVQVIHIASRFIII